MNISYEMPFLVTEFDAIAFDFGLGVPFPGSFQLFRMCRNDMRIGFFLLK